MTITTLLNIRCAEIHARFCGQRQFQAMPGEGLCATVTHRFATGGNPSEVSALGPDDPGSNFTGRSRSKRAQRLARHKQIRLWER